MFPPQTRISSSAIVPCITFNRAAPQSIYKQIYSGYRAAILEGRLRPGQRIPSTRALARELGVSRLPVLNAFEQLLHEGYIVARVGAGSFVTSSIPGELAGAPPERAREDRHGSQRPPRSGGRARDDHDNAGVAALGPFRVSLPALDRFPLKAWARLISRHARRLTPALMAYGDPAGYLPLRTAIADYLRTARAVRCTPDQVLIVSGSQMALQLCAKVLLKSGEEVLVEDPGYPGARTALAASGATLRPVPVDRDGLVVGSLTRLVRGGRVVYVTPSHQYPLGMSMSASRRLDLLDWARRRRAWIIEDDYDSEYRFASRPLGALQGMDSGSRVIYVGTFSKVLFPSLRVGYLVAPHSLITAFTEQREALDLFPPTLYQLALSDFLSEGHFARHLRRTRAVYLERRNALVAGIERFLPGTLTIANADAGMHLTAWLNAGVDDREVVRRAADREISAIALSTCYAGRPSRMGLVLGFGGANASEIERGVEVLVDVIEQCRRHTRARH